MKRIAWLIIVLLLAAGCSSAPAGTQQIADVTPSEAAGIIEQNTGNPDFVILDIRTPEEYSAGKIARSVNVDFYADDFQARLDQLDRDAHYLVYCNSGNRSGQSRGVFEDLGFARVDNLSTGIQGWYQEGLAVVP